MDLAAAVPSWLQPVLQQLAKYGVEPLHLATALVGLAVLLVVQALFRARGSRLPGPWSLPFLGTASLLPTSSRNQAILKLAEKYGGIFRACVGRTPYVFITDPALAHELLEQHDAKLSKDPRQCRSIARILPHPRTCLLTTLTQSDTWHVTRKCLSHSFSPTEISLDCDVARAKGMQLVEVLASLGPGVVVNMADATARLSLDILGLSKLGYDFGAVDTPEDVLLLRLLRECSGEWSARRSNPLRAWLWPVVDPWAEGRQKYSMLQDFVRSLWTELRALGKPEDSDCSLTAQLQRLRDPRTGNAVPESVLVSELAGQLLAGHEALSHGLLWTLYCLARDSACQEALHKELLDAGCVDDPDLLQLEALGQLPLLNGVVREGLRLHPTWSEGPVRITRERVNLGDGRVTLAKGTRVWVHTYSMHRAAHTWAEGNSFKPERWLAPSGSGAATGKAASDGFASSSDVSEAAHYLSPAVQTEPARKVSDGGGKGAGKKQGKAGVKKSVTADSGAGQGGRPSGPQLCARDAFMPFGAGARGCLGQVSAQAYVKISVALLIAYFKFELSGTDPELYKSTQGLSLRPPPEGLPLILTLRYPEMFQP